LRRKSEGIYSRELEMDNYFDLLNVDADLVAIEDLLGHSRITTTQCYSRVANLKVQRDYYKAIELLLRRTQPRIENEFESDKTRAMDDRV